MVRTAEAGDNDRAGWGEADAVFRPESVEQALTLARELPRAVPLRDFSCTCPSECASSANTSAVTRTETARIDNLLVFDDDTLDEWLARVDGVDACPTLRAQRVRARACLPGPPQQNDEEAYADCRHERVDAPAAYMRARKARMRRRNLREGCLVVHLGVGVQHRCLTSAKPSAGIFTGAGTI